MQLENLTLSGSVAEGQLELEDKYQSFDEDAGDRDTFVDLMGSEGGLVGE